MPIDYGESIVDNKIDYGSHKATQPPRHSTGNPWLESLLQGATFGFSDEMQAGAQAGYDVLTGNAPNFSQAYKENLAPLQAAQSTFMQQHPIAGLGGEFAGGMATGIGTAKTLSNLANVPRYVNYALTGGGLGALSGAGHAQPGERLQGAGIGGATGLAAGLAVPAIADVLRAPVRAVVDRFRAPGTLAQRKIAEALARDELTPAQAAARLRAIGNDATIADVGGENVLGLARASAAVPGPAKNRAALALTRRQLDRNQRVTDVIKRTLGDGEDYASALNRIDAERSAAAAPHYERAFRQQADIKNVIQYLDNEIPKQKGKISSALSSARSMLFDQKGNPETNIEVLHNVKSEIDDLISTAVKQDRKNAVRVLTIAQKRLIDTLDSASPDYRQGRLIFAGETRNQNALEQGRRFLRADSEITASALNNMADSEKEYFRIGAARAIRDKLLSSPDGGDAWKRIFGNELLREKLRAAFPSVDAYRDFSRMMKQEATFSRTRNTVLGGSPTARIEAEKADMAIDPGIVAEAAQGNVGGAALGALRNLLNKSNVPPERVREELGRLLFSRGVQGNETAVNALSAMMPQLSEQERRVLLQALSSGSAITGGSLFVPNR